MAPPVSPAPVEPRHVEILSSARHLGRRTHLPPDRPEHPDGDRPRVAGPLGDAAPSHHYSRGGQHSWDTRPPAHGRTHRSGHGRAAHRLGILPCRRAPGAQNSPDCSPGYRRDTPLSLDHVLHGTGDLLYCLPRHSPGTALPRCCAQFAALRLRRGLCVLLRLYEPLGRFPDHGPHRHGAPHLPGEAGISYVHASHRLNDDRGVFSCRFTVSAVSQAQLRHIRHQPQGDLRPDLDEVEDLPRQRQG